MKVTSKYQPNLLFYRCSERGINYVSRFSVLEQLICCIQESGSLYLSLNPAMGYAV